MRVQVLFTMLVLPAFVAGCAAPDDSSNGSGGDTGTPSGGASGGGNATAMEELANQTLTLGPQASNVLPGANASVTMPVNFTANYTRLVVNATIDQGTSVGLRFSGLGDCEGALDAPIAAGRTYTRECTGVMPGSYNLTFSHTSGSVTFLVVVLGER